MIIVFIDWYIKPGKVDEFLKFWKQTVQVNDRSGLVGEFLSKPADITYKTWITWNMNADIAADSATHETPEYERFINVGIWMEEKSFECAVAKYFNENKPPESFEFKRRRRCLLTPKTWRIGDGKLPACDSKGVL